MLFDLALSVHHVTHSLFSPLLCLHCSTFRNLKSETGVMEASDQGDGMGRERLFVCQFIFSQVNLFNLPPASWPLNPVEEK